jgi:hypothetical protein
MSNRGPTPLNHGMRSSTSDPRQLPSGQGLSPTIQARAVTRRRRFWTCRCGPPRGAPTGHAGELRRAGPPSPTGVGRASPRPCGGGGLVGKREGERKRRDDLCKPSQAETAASVSRYAVWTSLFAQAKSD